MRKRNTISSIAGQSGVSVSTVSLALNNRPGVSQGTRSRILQVAADLGYPVRVNPKVKKNDTLTTVGMVVKTDPDIPPQANPFYSKVMVGIEDACRQKGINLYFAALPVDDDNQPKEIPQLFYNERIDGLLMLGTFVDKDFTSATKDHGLPVVLVDAYASTESYDAVVSDNYRASYRAVEFLIQKGHREIGLVGSQEDCFPSIKQRRKGYLCALNDNDIHSVYFSDFNYNRSKGFQETTELLKAHPEITALFCVNDDVGSAAMRAAQSLEKKVPEDISIISFDDTDIATSAHPSLTTMHIDTAAMGRAALHLLALRFENPSSARMTLTIHPALIERDSVRSLPE